MRTKLPAASDRSYPVRKDRIHNQKQPVLCSEMWGQESAFLIASLIAKLHHFIKNDAINVDNEYIRCYDLTISL